MDLADPVIVRPPDASIVEGFAANELAKGIERLTQTRPEIVEAGPGARKNRIILVSADVTQAGVALSQAFSIRCTTKEGRSEVILTGKDRSLLYAVRDLVGKYLTVDKKGLLVKKVDVRESPATPRRYLWVWLHNLQGDWSRFVDFASEWKCNGVVIWGLDAWDDDKLCRTICEYAHIRGVDVIHGFGLNGYREGKRVCETLPDAKAVIPEKFRDTENGRWSLKAIYCPSNDDAKAKIREMLLKAANAGVDGFNFESADVDYITCHCSKCEARFQNQDEDLQENKPILWPIEHTNEAVELLSKERPGLWLSAEYAVQKFAKAPYVGSANLERLAKEIDTRCAVIWCESQAPPQEIADSLIRLRPESGFYLRSGAIYGLEGAAKYKWEDELASMRRLVPLKPRCIMYRSGLPQGYLAAKMAVAAEAMWDPTRPDAFFKQVFDKAMAETNPGGKYAVTEKK